MVPLLVTLLKKEIVHLPRVEYVNAYNVSVTFPLPEKPIAEPVPVIGMDFVAIFTFPVKSADAGMGTKNGSQLPTAFPRIIPVVSPS